MYVRQIPHERCGTRRRETTGRTGPPPQDPRRDVSLSWAAPGQKLDDTQVITVRRPKRRVGIGYASA